MFQRRILEKIEEEIALISSNWTDIGTTDEPAYYFVKKGNPVQGIIQIKEIEKGFLSTCSIFVKEWGMEASDSWKEELIPILSENFDFREVYLWPMEINEKMVLLASKKAAFETYLPGQMERIIEEIQVEWAEYNHKEV